MQFPTAKRVTKKVTEPQKKKKGEKSANPIINRKQFLIEQPKQHESTSSILITLSIFLIFSATKQRKINKIEDTQSYTKPTDKYTHTLTGTAVGWTRVSAETIAVAAAFMVSTLLLFTLLILFVSFRFFPIRSKLCLFFS